MLYHCVLGLVMKDTEDRWMQVIFPSNYPNLHVGKKMHLIPHFEEFVSSIFADLFFVYILLYFMFNFVS